MKGYLEEISNKIVKIKNFEDLDTIFNQKEKIYSYVNPFVYFQLKNYKEVLKNIDYFFLDGISLVIIFRLIGIKTIRLSPDMSSVFKRLFELSEKNQKRIYFIGTKDEILEKAINAIVAKYPKLCIAGYRNGFFMDEQQQYKSCEMVKKSQADILIVGMGTPYQEKFLNQVKKTGFQGLVFTCGGFLHQTAQNIDYYPNWINKFNLRWVYRMIDERRVFVRTIKYYPLFCIIFFVDLLKGKLLRV